jgi:DivIVA domain-containing protein
MLMPSTPADIQNVVFGRAAAGRRGFDADEVDAFVLAVGDELAFLVEENSRLRALLDGVDEHAATASAEQLTVLRGQLAQALRDRTAAEQVALALRAELDQAHRQPAPAPAAGGGGGQVGRVLAVAQRTAEACVTDAEREADDLLSEARATVQKITQHAQTTADLLEQDARSRHREAMAKIDAKRTAMQQRIQQLAQLERDYYARLKTYLENQISDLDPGRRDERGEAVLAESVNRSS